MYNARKYNIEDYLVKGDINLLAKHFNTSRQRVSRALKENKDISGHHDIRSFAVNMIDARLLEVQAILPFLKEQIENELTPLK